MTTPTAVAPVCVPDHGHMADLVAVERQDIDVTLSTALLVGGTGPPPAVRVSETTDTPGSDERHRKAAARIGYQSSSRQSATERFALHCDEGR